MKLLFHTALLLAISFFTFSCKAKQEQVMKEHYRTANKYSVLEKKLLKDNNSLLLSNSTLKNNDQGYNNPVSLQPHQDQVNSGEYKVLYDDSEIANGDVYREAAAHRQQLINDCNCGETKTGITNSAGSPTSATPVKTNTTASVKTTPAAPSSTPQAPEVTRTPTIFAHLLDAEKKPIRRVRVSLINESDRDRLKQYSVIIAALSKPASVERLKKAFATSGDQIFFVQNELGLYYAIIGSYETESQAGEKIRRVYMEYTNLYTPEQLFDKYGIKFADLWILKRMDKNEN
jgi:hypothetical protein